MLLLPGETSCNVATGAQHIVFCSVCRGVQLALRGRSQDRRQACHAFTLT